MLGRWGEIWGLIMARMFLGSFCGFVVLMIVSWTLMYFEAMPAEPEATTHATYLFLVVALMVALIGSPAARVVLLQAPIFLVGAAIVLGVVQAQAVIAQPDLNGDGLFTIRDFIHGIALSVFAVGQVYGEFLFGPIDGQNSIVTFLEIPAWVILWTARVGLTAFVWFVAIYWTVMIINYQTPRPEPG